MKTGESRPLSIDSRACWSSSADSRGCWSSSSVSGVLLGLADLELASLVVKNSPEKYFVNPSQPSFLATQPIAKKTMMASVSKVAPSVASLLFISSREFCARVSRLEIAGARDLFARLVIAFSRDFGYEVSEVAGYSSVLSTRTRGLVQADLLDGSAGLISAELMLNMQLFGTKTTNKPRATSAPLALMGQLYSALWGPKILYILAFGKKLV